MSVSMSGSHKLCGRKFQTDGQPQKKGGSRRCRGVSPVTLLTAIKALNFKLIFRILLNSLKWLEPDVTGMSL